MFSNARTLPGFFDIELVSLHMATWSSGSSAGLIAGTPAAGASAIAGVAPCIRYGFPCSRTDEGGTDIPEISTGQAGHPKLVPGKKSTLAQGVTSNMNTGIDAAAAII